MTQKLKRYDVHENHPESISAMAEFPDGEYVKFEDYEKLKAQLEKAEAVLEWFNKRYTGEEGTYAREYFKEKGE